MTHHLYALAANRGGGGGILMCAGCACLALALSLHGGAAWAEDYVDVANQQSHPSVGQTWTVEFEAGGGELRVSGYGGTVLGDGPEADVSFEYLLGPGGARMDGSAGENYVAFDGYGPGTGHLAVTVKTPGAHHLRLQSGSAVSYAHNWAYPESASKIQTGTSDGPSVSAGADFGESVAGIGDLDRDGVPDIVAGAPGNPSRGQIHVMFMNSDGTAKRTAGIHDGTPFGPILSSGDNFGSSAAGVGDLDGDGVPDVAAGAPGDDAGGPNRGAIHVLFMKPDGTVKRTSAINSSTANGPSLSDGDEFGSSLAGVGDLDRDGVPDVAAGAPGDDAGGNGRGAVHLLFMNSDGTVKRTAEINSSTANGPSLEDGDAFGSSVAGIGDLDGDGIGDVAAGAEGDDGTGGASANRGAVHVLLMNRDGTAKRASEISSSTPGGPSLEDGDAFGSSAAALGDIDADGTPDIAAGAPGDDAGGSGRGAVHVLLMNPDGTAKRASEISSSTPGGPSLSDGDAFGSSAAGIGDLDGDGIRDVAAGAPRAGSAGDVHVVRMDAIAPRGSGAADAVEKAANSTSTRLRVPAGDRFGWAAANAGDINGDGFAEIAVGSPHNDTGGENRGELTLLFTKLNGTLRQIAQINSSTAGGPQLANWDAFGSAAAGVGDLDGDGVPDVAAGARDDDAGGTDRGAVHVLLMNRDGTVKRASEINSSTANGPSLSDGDEFGSSLAGVGDLDGDGVPDVAAGAPEDNDGHNNRGAVHVMFMNRDGTVKRTAEINNSTANGPALIDNDNFGSSLAGVGDLDGDGVPDVAAGAPEYGVTGNENRGTLYVLFMNRDGTVKRTAEIDSSTANGPSLSNGDFFGQSAAALGDLDGDGVTDVAAGAPGDDAGGNGRGAVHVLFLNSDGTVKRTAEINSATPNGPGISDADSFGSSVAGMGDLDGDGVPDVAAGAENHDAGSADAGNNSGAIHVLLMNPDGTVKGAATFDDTVRNGPPLDDMDAFGSGVAGIGDVDGDGVPDLAAGARSDDEVEDGRTRNRGAVYVMFMDPDGTVERMARIDARTPNGPRLADFDLFGSSLAGVGDLDRDGVPDLAAGAPNDDAGGFNRGAVHAVFLNSDGTVKRTAEINSLTARSLQLGNVDLFGSSLAGVGDLDRDGVPDIAAGAQGDDAGGNGRGAVHLLFMNSDGTVKRTAEINSSTANGPSLDDGDAFGSSAAGIGDLDGDGVPDVAAGAEGDDGAGGASTNSGAVHIMFLNSDGTVKRTAEINGSTPNGPGAGRDGLFGAVSAAGDVDRDGTPDILAGARGDDPRRAGDTAPPGDAYVILMNSDGSVKRTVAVNSASLPGATLSAGEKFGASAALAGDLNRDGAQDLAVGAIGSESRGAVYVMLMGSDAVVVNATSTAADGRYRAGSFDLTVEFSEPVVVAGIPKLELETGAADAVAPYVSGSGTDTLAFRYAVADGHASDDLDYVGANSLSLDGGAIRAAGGLSPDAGLSLPVPGRAGSISFNKDIVVDTARPLLSRASIDLGTGTLSVVFDEEIGARVDVSSVTLKDAHGLNPTALAGARVSVDGRTAAISVTEEQRTDLILGRNRIALIVDDPPILMDVSGSAVRDLAGNFFAGTTSHPLDVVSDSIPPALDGLPVADFVAGTLRVGFTEEIDVVSMDVSGIALLLPDRSERVALAGSTAEYSDGAVLITFSDGHNRSLYETGIASRGSALLDVSALAAPDVSSNYFPGVTSSPVIGHYYAAVQDSPALSGSASSRLSAAESSDEAVFSDSARAFKSGSAPSDVPAVSDSSRALKSALLPSDEAVFSDSARAFKSGSAPSDVPAVSDSATARLSAAALSDTPSASDSASAVSHYAAPVRDTAVFSDSARSFKSGFSASDAAVLLDSATARLSAAALSDTPSASDSASAVSHYAAPVRDTAVFSDSARAFKSGSAPSDVPAVSDSATARLSAAALSDTPSASDSASAVSHYAAPVRDTAVFSDSARSFKSGFSASDAAVLLDSATAASMNVGLYSDTAVFSDSARSFKSGFSASDAAVLLDSATAASMNVGLYSDTAVFSDSARSFKSGFSASDAAVLLDSATAASMNVGLYSDTAVFSDSARSFKSGFSASDAAVLLDSATAASMNVGLYSDTAVFSDSARSFKSSSVSSDSPALSDFAERAGMMLVFSTDSSVFSDSARSFKSSSVSSDSPAFSDSASAVGMLASGLSDSATVSDSARSFKSGFSPSDVAYLSDSAAAAGMQVRTSGDTAVFSDSARSSKSTSSAYDSLAPSDSASYAGLFAQGTSDSAQFSDSVRQFRSAIVESDSPSLSDSAFRLGAASRSQSNSLAPSDSARAYKSALTASSAPFASDSARHGSMRAASDSDSPVLADSALARISSIAESDSPVLADSARAGASAMLLSDSPGVLDGAATGQHPKTLAGDAPSVSDGASHEASAARAADAGAATGWGGRQGGQQGPTGGPALGSGDTGTDLAVIHAVSYDRCSDEPYVEVVASPAARTVVTIEQASTATVAHQAGQRAGAPDSAVWTAPILPDARSLQIRAAHHGDPVTDDRRSVDTGSCSGSVKFTPFDSLPGPAPPAPPPGPEAQPAERRAGPPEVAPPARPAGSAAAPPAEPARQAAELQPEQGREPAAPAEPAQSEEPTAADLTREPRAGASAEKPAEKAEPGSPPLWYAAAAAVAAAAVAVLAKRRRARAA